MVAKPGGFSWAYYSAPIVKFLQDGDGCLAALAKYGATAGSALTSISQSSDLKTD